MSLHLPEVGNRGDEGWFPTDVSPKALGKGAARDQVIRCLRGPIAELTCIRIHDVLLQVTLALDALLDEKPGEEPDLWRGMVLPNEAVVGTSIS